MSLMWEWLGTVPYPFSIFSFVKKRQVRGGDGAPPAAISC